MITSLNVQGFHDRLEIEMLDRDLLYILERMGDAWTRNTATGITPRDLARFAAGYVLSPDVWRTPTTGKDHGQDTADRH